LAIEFRNCIGQHLAMSGVCRRFQLAGEMTAGEKQALALAITFALFGRECWAGRLIPLRHRVLLLLD
jgi:hypothetical protein